MGEFELGPDKKPVRPIRIVPRPPRRRTFDPEPTPIPIPRRILPTPEITPPHPNQPSRDPKRKAA